MVCGYARQEITNPDYQQTFCFIVELEQVTPELIRIQGVKKYSMGVLNDKIWKQAGAELRQAKHSLS